MKRFRASIYQLKNGEVLGINEYMIESSCKDTAWEESLKLAFDISLLSVYFMVYLKEDTIENEDDIYDIF